MHIPKERTHRVNKKTQFCLFFFMFVFLFALLCFELCLVSILFYSHCIVFVLDMHTSLCYCASLNACLDDHLFFYMIIVVISLWLFWCMIKLLICFTQCLLVTLYLPFYYLLYLEGLICFVQVFQVFCSKFITASKFRCEWVLPLFPNSHLSLEFVLGCFVME